MRTYSLTFFGKASQGVRSAKRFDNLADAEQYATEHLAFMVKSGKSFRKVSIFCKSGSVLRYVKDVTHV